MLTAATSMYSSERYADTDADYLHGQPYFSGHYSDEFIQLSSDDSNASSHSGVLPSHYAPAPLPQLPSSLSDPDLAITPEKTRHNSGTSKGWNPNLKSRVRFDLDSFESSSSGMDSLNTNSYRQFGSVKPSKTTVVCEKNTVYPSGKSQVRQTPKITNSLDIAPDLSTPEMHATHALGIELLDFKAQQFDPESAVASKLKESLMTRMKLTEECSRPLNLGRNMSHYDQLVSLDVPVKQLVDMVVDEKLAKVRPPSPRKQEKSVPLPDIMDFFTKEHQKETAVFDTGLPPPTAQSVQAPADAAFDLYHRTQCWEDRLS